MNNCFKKLSSLILICLLMLNSLYIVYADSINFSASDTILSVAYSDDLGAFFATGNNGLILKSTDDGASWTKVNAGLPSTINFSGRDASNNCDNHEDKYRHATSSGLAYGGTDGNKKFIALVAIASKQNVVYYSDAAGECWYEAATKTTDNADVQILRICYDSYSNNFYGITNILGVVAYSDGVVNDGVMNWTLMPTLNYKINDLVSDNNGGLYVTGLADPYLSKISITQTGVPASENSVTNMTGGTSAIHTAGYDSDLGAIFAYTTGLYAWDGTENAPQLLYTFSSAASQRISAVASNGDYIAVASTAKRYSQDTAIVAAYNKTEKTGVTYTNNFNNTIDVLYADVAAKPNGVFVFANCLSGGLTKKLSTFTPPITVTDITKYEKVLPEVSNLVIDCMDNATFGDTLTANYDYANTPGDANFEIYWLRSNDNGGFDVIGGETQKTYVLKDEDMGKKISFKVIPKDFTDPLLIGREVECTSYVTPYIEPAKPVVCDVALVSSNSNNHCGTTLSCTYTFYDINGDNEDESLTEYNWYTTETEVFENPTLIETVKGKSNNTYTTKPEDNGKWFWAGVVSYSKNEPKKSDEAVQQQGSILVKGGSVYDDIMSIEIPETTDSDIYLYREGTNGSTISWESSDTSVINIDGSVFRKGTDRNVELKATVRKDGCSLTKTFNVNVKAAVIISGGGGGNSSSGGGRVNKGSSSSGGGSTVTMPFPNIDATLAVEKFSDIENCWAKNHINNLLSKKIITMNNEKMFYPDNNATRTEFVKMIVNSFNITATDNAVYFTDVKEGEWYVPYVAAAFENGLINGTGNGLFGVENNISRQDIAVIIYRAIKKYNVPVENETNSISFNDEKEISDYASEAVKAMQAMGILSGDENNNFRPYAKATRAEIAKILSLVIEQIGR